MTEGEPAHTTKLAGLKVECLRRKKSGTAQPPIGEASDYPEKGGRRCGGESGKRHSSLARHGLAGNADPIARCLLFLLKYPTKKLAGCDDATPAQEAGATATLPATM